MVIWEQTATCATYSINWLVFITEMKSVYSAVRTGSLNKTVCASSLKSNINITRTQYFFSCSYYSIKEESTCKFFSYAFVVPPEQTPIEYKSVEITKKMQLCNRIYYSKILLKAQHVSSGIPLIIRSSSKMYLQPLVYIHMLWPAVIQAGWELDEQYAAHKMLSLQ
jgi:hypothetical protein